MRPVEQLESILSRLLHWIANADAKTAPVLAISTSMLGFIAALAPKPPQWSLGLALLAFLVIIPLIATLVGLFFVTFPRTEGLEGSMIYFKGIASRSKADYINDALHREEPAYTNDLAEQCHRNAQIACAKFRALRFSMICLFCSIGPWLILVWRFYQLRI